jgi:hypothetical protein
VLIERFSTSLRESRQASYASPGPPSSPAYKLSVGECPCCLLKSNNDMCVATLSAGSLPFLSFHFATAYLLVNDFAAVNRRSACDKPSPPR